MWTSEGLEVCVEDSKVWDAAVARFQTACDTVAEQTEGAPTFDLAPAERYPGLDITTSNGLTGLAALRWEDS
jgi:hypothetical protein